MKTLKCRHCGKAVEVSISFGVTNPLGEGVPLLHFHPQCFIEIAGAEYLEEMFELARCQIEKAPKKKR